MDKPNASPSPKTVNDILTEKELLDLLGLKKTALDSLRYNRRLPFCKVTDRSRIYLVEDVLNFLLETRTVLNKAK